MESRIKCTQISYILIWIIYTTIIVYDFISNYSETVNIYAFWSMFSIYLISSILFIWSWWITCWGDPGSLKEFYREKGILKNLEEGVVPSALSSLKVCKKCRLPKPQRCHHCSEFNECYFRYDHYCPMMGNVIGLYNIKAFILFHVYGGIVFLIGGVEVFIMHYNNVQLMLVGVVLMIIGLTTSSMTTIWTESICKNKTSVEQNVGEYCNDDYDKGCFSNWREIFAFPASLLPIKPPINGFHWENEEVRNYISSINHGLISSPLL